MFHARYTEYVQVPHLVGLIRNTDEAILEAYKKHPFPPPPATALREARAGGLHHAWAVWEGDRYTGVRSISEYWCRKEAEEMAKDAEEQARPDQP